MGGACCGEVGLVTESLVTMNANLNQLIRFTLDACGFRPSRVLQGKSFLNSLELFQHILDLGLDAWFLAKCIKHRPKMPFGYFVER
jgi:enamine deaminase RidA (YjgF/YER057c/UK114 family)